VPYTNLSVGGDYKAAFPSFHILGLEDTLTPPHKSSSPRITQTHQQETVVGAGSELKNTGEIQVLSDEETPCPLRCLPYLGIVKTCQPFLWDGVDIMPHCSKDMSQPCRQILVELNSHMTPGTPFTGKSSPAEAAANAITARTWSSVSVGKSSRSS